MSDYLTATQEQAVAATVYMEVDVDPDQRQPEIEYVTALCEDADNPMQGAVVSGEPASPDFTDYVMKISNNPYVKGVRRVLHWPEMPAAACLQDDFVRGVQFLGDPVDATMCRVCEGGGRKDGDWCPTCQGKMWIPLGSDPTTSRQSEQ